jgi:hypothetical protein
MHVNPSRDRSRSLRAGARGHQNIGSTQGPPDRRADRRYPIAAELEYRIINRGNVVKIGLGRTIDISSAGVLFESEIALPRGLKVELIISWPSLPTTSKRIEIRAEGRTVRADHKCTAVRIYKYTFRGAPAPGAGEAAGTL